MSKSRLEKFLYALYSLDSSDLPTPLSRIEELYKCLVTGEEPPTFEPLSRVEKYLMTILGVYDVDSLPNPLSRVEVLLYKLATGDDNLDDVKSFLSEHEELLAEIIRNGDVGGNIDIEYVLYTLSTEFNTLYNTAEKPVKSAVLTGQTLVNMVTLDTTKEYVLEQDGSSIKSATFNLIDGFENNIYTIILEMSNVNIVNPNGEWVMYIYTSSEIDNGADNTTIKSFIKNGRVSFTYKPSREKKTKNWFKISLHTDSGIGSTITIKNVVILKGDHTQEDIPYFEGMQSVKMPVLTTSNEDGTKTNILTVNEEVELRGIGDMKDELNLLTGEMTQRVGKVVLDGSEKWLGSTVGSSGTFMRFYITVQDSYLNEDGSDILSDRFASIPHGYWDTDIEGIHSKKTVIHINIPTSKLESNDISGFKKWLSSNPVTVYYRLATESVKTVDLSVVNQDGNDTELSTFDDITHVTLSSEGLIPEAELEVATKNEEVLNTMSLEMDDISTTQTTLEETSNTQSENIDATMIATTEIYEELL